MCPPEPTEETPMLPRPDMILTSEAYLFPLQARKSPHTLTLLVLGAIEPDLSHLVIWTRT